MTRGLQRFQESGQSHFVTFSCYHRQPNFATPELFDLFVVCLENTRHRFGLCVYGYVIMPEHVHLLVSEPPKAKLADAIHDLKLSFSKLAQSLSKVKVVKVPQVRARSVGANLGPFWQARYYDRNVRDYDEFRVKLRYLHRNPVKRGLVAKPDNWKWSSYRHYAFRKTGVIEIESQWTATDREQKAHEDPKEYSSAQVNAKRRARTWGTRHPEHSNLQRFGYTHPDRMHSRPAPTSSSPLRFLVPSSRDIIFLLLFWSVLVGPLSNRPLADADVGWHIRTGELILATHSIPRTDPFSSTMQGQAWFAWEWLYDTLLGVLYHACGLNGVVWLCALLVASIFVFLLWLLLKKGTGLPLAIVLMLLAEAAATIHLYARPHIVSWLFSLLWFVALERWEQQPAPRWLRWFFPASMVLWVNLHGGWIFGLVLLGTYALAAFIESLRTADAFARMRTRKRAHALGYALLWSGLATLVNPYGWRLHAHVYRYLGDRYLINRISEFQSPDFHGWAERCFGTILLLALIGFAGNRRALPLRHLLVALLAAYAGLYSSRNLPVSSMLLVLIAGPILWETFVFLAEKPGGWTWVKGWVRRISSFSDRMCAQELALHGHLWPVVTVIAALTICMQGGRLGSRQLIQARFDPHKLPVAGVTNLQRGQSTEPIFSIDAWGGYLIYRLYPDRKVVVDDRHDLYGSDRIREYLTLVQAEPRWDQVLEKWQITTALLPARSTLANLLRELPREWHPVYEDDVAVVFKKDFKREFQKRVREAPKLKP